MTTESLRKIQMEVYEIFKEFDILCRKYKLRYYMLGGTMLGAVRHKGFIPWDDDMDVGMPREDYEKLLIIGKKYFEHKNFKLLNGRWEEEFIFDFSKIMKKIEIDNKSLEIFLDIFPLDGCPNTDLKGIKKYYQKFDILRMMKNTHLMLSLIHI